MLKYLIFAISLFLAFSKSNQCLDVQKIFNDKILPQAIKSLQIIKLKNVQMDLWVTTAEATKSTVLSYESTEFEIKQSNPCILEIFGSATGVVDFTAFSTQYKFSWEIKGAQMKVHLNKNNQVTKVLID